ncbi:MAG TPA: redoxin family protein [Hyphomonadaceae bacterium]|nr:redoxin family protein [Hyphomonadaceae bacterium]
MNRWLAWTPLALLLVLVIVAFTQLTGKNPEPASFTSPVRPMPAVQLDTLDGGKVDFAAMKGQPYLVNVWATWCGPCQAEHPMLLELQKQGVPIVGVVFEDPNPKIPVADWLASHGGNPFVRVALDPQGDAALAIGISGVPETFLVDASGHIVKTLRTLISDQAHVDDFVAAYRAEVAKAGPAAIAPAPKPAD